MSLFCDFWTEHRCHVLLSCISLVLLIICIVLVCLRGFDSVYITPEVPIGYSSFCYYKNESYT